MTTAELLAALARERPKGVSFDPMAVRLLRQRVPFEDWQIEDLKAAMFQLGSGLWFSLGMILDDKPLLAFYNQATAWLRKHGCFSVERLFVDFHSVFSHIATQEDCAAFLEHLGFTVAEWGKGGCFCFQPPDSLDNNLAAISEMIDEWLEEAGSTLTVHEIEQEMPHLTAEALECVRAHFLPEVHAVEVGGVPCWCSTEAIHLPEDFSEVLTTAVDTLVELDEKVSAAKLEFALNLFYRIRLREEYALTDNDTFMRVCAKNYQGGNDVFPKKKRRKSRLLCEHIFTREDVTPNNSKPCIEADDWSVPGKRVRSPNTRFSNLGVPIGAKLVFTKDSQITCTVLDDSNQVEYDGKPWAISALATQLLARSAANGFYHFTYEGETLWDRRLRLQRVDSQDEPQADEVMSPAEVHEAEGKIIGLAGRPLSPSTWRGFCAAGTNPRVAEWVRLVENGESYESIARESGIMPRTVMDYIIKRSRYLDICEKNGIVPESGTNV